MNESSIKIVFWGTSRFGIPSLEALIKNGYEIIAVITTPDEPTGRKQIITPPPIKSWLQTTKYRVQLFQPQSLKIDSLANSLEIENLKLKIADADVGIVASYGKIIPKEFLTIPKYGFLNIHPSLLPKYRGPTPIQTVILNGEEKTGVTIMSMDEQMDHGPIIIKHETEIMKHDNYKTLYDKLAEFGANLLIVTLPKWIRGKIKSQEQDHTEATFTKKFTRENGYLNFEKPAEYLDRQIRALNPEPGTWVTTKSKIKNPWPHQTKQDRQKTKSGDKKENVLKIIQAEPDNEESGLYVGTVFKNSKNQIAVQCKTDSLVLLSLQKGGGKILSVQEFINGHKDFIGSRLNIV